MNAPPAVAEGLDAVRAGFLEVALEGDRFAAFEIVERALGGGHALQAVYLQVFQPVLREIGQRWQANELSVADEHLVTGITQAAMARLFQRSYQWVEPTGRSLVAACADLERHEVGLRMIADLLEIEGWSTTYLGATVPLEGLADMVSKRRPDVVALSVTLAPHLPRVAAMIEALREQAGEGAPFVLLGGRAFLEDPGLAERLGADASATDAMQAVTLLRDRFPPV